MSTMPPKQPTASPGRPATPDDKTPVAPPFDEQLRVFWLKNHNAVYVGCALVLLAMIGRYAYETLAVRREAASAAAYAAATTPARLQAFARDHARHPLAGAAWLKLADDAYTAGYFAEALSSYEKAAAGLPGTPFAARALLGKAMCQIQSGKTAEGMAALKQMADDAVQLRGLRCEAAFHLASLAVEAGDADEVVKRTDQIMQLDTSGTWSQRAALLRARMPVKPGATVSAKTGEAAPAVSVKVPGP